MVKRIIIFLLLVSVLLYTGCGGGDHGIKPSPQPTTGNVTGKVSGFQVSSFNSTFLKGDQPTSKTVVKSFYTSSAPEIVPNEKTIKFRPGVSESEVEKIIRSMGGKIKKKIYGEPDTYLVKFETQQFSTYSFDSNPQIEYMEDNVRLHAFETPDDSLYTNQEWNCNMINLPAAWDIQIGNENVVVAVIDSGVSLTHPDLIDNLVAGYDFVDDDTDPSDNSYHVKMPISHGTHVAGIISAVTDNNLGVAGVAWNVKIMPVRVLGPDGSGNSADIASGINWAVNHGAHVINLSLGVDGMPAALGPKSIKTAIDAAIEQGVTVIAAAGNQNREVAFPANYSPVIAVAALNREGSRANYSNFGPEISVAAPGGGLESDTSNSVTFNVYSTFFEKNPGGGGTNTYDYLSGTSMACPHVSGVVALLYSKGITNPYAIKDRIQTKAYDLGEVGKDNEYGYGRINAYAALNELNPDVRSVKVFACDSNDLIVGTPRNPDSLGNYALSDLPAGTWTICAFYDKDLNGLVNASDQFAFTTEPVTVLIGRTTQGVNLELMEITGLSTSMSLEEYVRSTIK